MGYESDFEDEEHQGSLQWHANPVSSPEDKQKYTRASPLTLARRTTSSQNCYEQVYTTSLFAPWLLKNVQSTYLPII